MVIKKRYQFDAAHYIPEHEKCGRLHGHTWHVTVFIGGSIDEGTNMLLDFHDLNAVVRPMISKLDHTVINEEFLDFPSAERIAEALAEDIRVAFQGRTNIGFIGVEIQEGEGGSAKIVVDTQTGEEIYTV
jgi:6-pyruvoyltetrahydropterin/6-carboxytetrahydropterin synthase